MCTLGDCTILSGACFSLLPEIVFATENTVTPHCGKRSPSVFLCNSRPAFLVTPHVCDTQPTFTPTNLLVQRELCSRPSLQ